MTAVNVSGVVPDVDTETLFKMVSAGVGVLGSEFQIDAPSPGVFTITKHKNRARHGLVGLVFMSPRETVTIVASEGTGGTEVVINGQAQPELADFLSDLVVASG